ncbi:Fur family transcriptional regulator [Chloroflexota bacterium]
MQTEPNQDKFDKRVWLHYYVNDNVFHLQVEMRLTEKKVTGILRRHGYKLTPQRRVIIQAIISTNDHLTPATIYEKLRQDYPDIGLVTIYRTLRILAKLELICELHAGESCRSYTISTSYHHHHLICSSCGTVIDFIGHYVSELEQKLSRQTGFKIEGHLLEFTGLCQACQKAVTQVYTKHVGR